MLTITEDPSRWAPLTEKRPSRLRRRSLRLERLQAGWACCRCLVVNALIQCAVNRRHRSDPDHGLVQVSESFTVNRQLVVSWAIRVKRSTTRNDLLGGPSRARSSARSLKFVVSTTSVSVAIGHATAPATSAHPEPSRCGLHKDKIRHWRASWKPDHISFWVTLSAM